MGWLLKLAAGNPLALLWIAGGVFLAGLAAGGSAAWYVQAGRLEAANARTTVVQTKYDSFAAEVKTAGEAMRDNAIAQAKTDKAKKEKADAEIKLVRNVAVADVERMRAERDAARGGGGIVPSSASNATSPDRACFDRAQLESAFGELYKGIRSLSDEGSAAVIGLDGAKRWAQGL